MDDVNIDPAAPNYREDVQESKVKTRRRKTETRKPRSRGGPGEFNLKLTVIAVIIMIIIIPFINYINALKQEVPEPITVINIEKHIWRLNSDLKIETYYAGVDFLTSETTYGLDIQELEQRIESRMNFIIHTLIEPAYSNTDGFRMEVEDFLIELRTVPVYTTNYDYFRSGIDPGLGPELPHDTSYSIASPGNYRIEASYTMVVTDIDNNADRSEIEFGFSVEINDIYPFLENSRSLFQFDYTTAGGRLQRTVTYMLTTLVRHRMRLDYGHGPYESPLNVLNQGDVELAVNMALVFEELSVLNMYDNDAVSAIDRFYKSARDPKIHVDEPNWSPQNPTGNRYWSSAELENYDTLHNHVVQSGIDRSFLLQIQSLYDSGKAFDPADVFALYMIFDRELSGFSINPVDDTSLLDELALWDPRTPADRTDVNNIKLKLNVTDPFVFRFQENPFDGWTEQQAVLKVDHEPDYLVSGRDFSVSGLNNPKGWYTDIIPTNTRTWGVPPSVAPPTQHDFRVQWDLKITGDFVLNLGALWNRDFAGMNGHAEKIEAPSSFPHDVWNNGTINIDFPVTIFGWLAVLPLNNAISFKNLNPQIFDFNNDTWIQTPGAQAKEYFSARLWSGLKPFAAAAMGKLNNNIEFTRRNAGTGRGTLANSIYLSLNEEFYRDELKTVLDNTATFFWPDLELFTETYLMNYSVTDQYRTDRDGELWLNEDGLNITIEYSDDYQDVSFIFKHHSGSFTLDFFGVTNSGEPESLVVEGDVIIQSLDRFDEMVRYTYSIPVKGQNSAQNNFLKGMIGSEQQFEITYETASNNLGFSDIYGFGSPDEMIEIELPVFDTSGVEYDLTVIFGFYTGSGSNSDPETGRDTFVNELAGKLPPETEFTDGETNGFARARTGGRIHSIIQTALENEFIRSADDLMIGFNMKIDDGKGDHSINELGFHVRNGRAIKDIGEWISLNNIDLITLLSNPVFQNPTLIQLLTQSFTGIDEDAADDIDIYLFTEFSNIFSINGGLDSYIYHGGMTGSGFDSIPSHGSLNIARINAYPSFTKDAMDDSISTLKPDMLPRIQNTLGYDLLK